MVLLSIIQQASSVGEDVNPDAQQAAFFGFIGIASALVFASKYLIDSYSSISSKRFITMIKYRLGSRLRYC